MTIDILYLEGCLGYADLLPRLRDLVRRASPGTTITVRSIPDHDSAVCERFLGSPTIRINGRDIESGAQHRNDFGLKCRLYRTPDGLVPTPPDEWLLKAIARG